MKMYPEFENEYAISRLNDSIIAHEGRLVSVSSVVVGFRNLEENYSHLFDLDVMESFLKTCANSYLIGTDVCQSKFIAVPLEDVDPTPVKLGYINHEKSCSYIVRAPMREDWRQGFRFNNLRSLDGNSPCDIAYKYYRNTVFNIFPTLREAMDLLNSGTCDKVAWCRDWAASCDGVIFSKGRVVGSWSSGCFVLDQNFKYLQESLDEVS